jgi:hypothetical protein
MDNDEAVTRAMVRAAFSNTLDVEPVVKRVVARVSDHDRDRKAANLHSRLGLGFTAGAVAMIALVGANAVGAYADPAYARSLSRAPLIGLAAGPVLRLAGIDTSQVTSVSETSSSSGHTLSLVAVYADQVRTVLVVYVDGKPALPSKTAFGYNLRGVRVEDQYGHEYTPYGRQYTGAGQGSVLDFQPLTGPAAKGQATLTLHVDGIFLWQARTSTDQPLTKSTVSGNWTLQTKVTRQAGSSLPLPQPVQKGDLTYTVTSLQVSGKLVRATWIVTGGKEISDIYQAAKDGQVGYRQPGPALARQYVEGGVQSADGNGVSGGSSGYVVQSSQAVTGHTEVVVPAPGKYVLVIGDTTQAKFPIDIS